MRCLVTGGTSGIDRALAEAFRAKGNKVIIAERRQSLLDEVTGCNPDMVAITVDLSESSAIATFAESVKNQFPDLKTSVEVLELLPPYVQQSSAVRSRPVIRVPRLLLSTSREVVEILVNNTVEKGEILVERVRPLRTAEKDGKYQKLLKMFAVMHE